MLTSPAQRAPKSNLVVPIILGVILVPLSQLGVAYLGGRGGSLMGWLVGTPICYFLIGGMAAFTTVSGLVPAQARGRGAWVGFTAGISGACSAVLIVGAIVIWNFAASPQSAFLLHPQAGVMPRALYFGMTMPGSKLQADQKSCGAMDAPVWARSVTDQAAAASKARFTGMLQGSGY